MGALLEYVGIIVQTEERMFISLAGVGEMGYNSIRKRAVSVS